jgi:uncharacterized protein with von Willebrand factor type A (vWA) domain
MRRGRELAACPRWEATELDENAAADFHALAFDPQAEFQPCEDRTREKFIGAMVETPEFHALHSETMLDDYAAQIAALHFGDQFAEFKRKNEAGKPEGGGTAGEGDIAGEVAAIGAAGKAIAAAAGEVKELKEAMGALGMGAGEKGGKRDPKAVADAFNRVRNNPTLRRICEAAGRFRRVAQSKQRLKTMHGIDDVVGVEFGADLSRVLPHELAKMDIEELELDMLRRLAERQALCRELAAVEPVGKGPIIVTLDESGSMRDKIENAKGLALSLAWIARQQKRWCAIVAYSGDTGQRVIQLPPGRWDDAAVCKWLLEFIGGGSDIDVPVREPSANLRRPETAGRRYRRHHADGCNLQASAFAGGGYQLMEGGCTGAGHFADPGNAARRPGEHFGRVPPGPDAGRRGSGNRPRAGDLTASRRLPRLTRRGSPGCRDTNHGATTMLGA